jgi:shikimate kinase
VVLVGLMGSGKSTVGAILSQRLGLLFRDGDALLEAATGRTAAALRDGQGVDALHRAEGQVLREALAWATPSVIAAAASAVDDPACRAALRSPDVAVAWLRADPEVLGRRFAAGAGGDESHRPAYGEKPRAFLAAQARRRAARVAACRPLVVVDTGALGPEEASRRIEAALRTAPGGDAR